MILKKGIEGLSPKALSAAPLVKHKLPKRSNVRKELALLKDHFISRIAPAIPTGYSPNFFLPICSKKTAENNIPGLNNFHLKFYFCKFGNIILFPFPILQ